MKTQSAQIGEAIKTKEARRLEIRRATMARREQWQVRVKAAKIGGMPKVFLGISLWR